MTTAKNAVLIGLEHENCYVLGDGVGNWLLVRGESTGGIFRWGGWANFQLVGGGGDSPYPPVGKTQVFQATCTSAVPVLYKSSGIILQEFVWK